MITWEQSSNSLLPIFKSNFIHNINIAFTLLNIKELIIFVWALLNDFIFRLY